MRIARLLAPLLAVVALMGPGPLGVAWAQQSPPADSARSPSPLSDSLQEALARFERAQPPTAVDSAALRRWADSVQAKGTSLRGRQPPRARTYLNQALQARRTLVDSAEAASIISEMGVTRYYQSQYEEALHRFQESLALYRDLGNEPGIADAFNRIGNVHENQGRYAEALSYLQKSLAIARRLENKRDIAAALTNIGIVHENQRRYDEALQHYREALPISRELKDLRVTAYVLNNVGNVYENQGRYEEALQTYKKALAIQRERNDRRGIAAVSFNMGIVYERQGHFEDALRQYRQALQLNRKIGRRLGAALNLYFIGDNHRAQSHLQAATDTLERAVTLAEELRLNATSPEARRSLLSTQIGAYQALTSTYVHAGRPDSALRAIEQARARLLAERLTGTAHGDSTFAIPAARSLHQTMGANEAALLYTNAGTERPLTVLAVTQDTTVARELPDSTIRADLEQAYASRLDRLRREEGPLTAALSEGASSSSDTLPSLAETIRLYRYYLTRGQTTPSVQRDLARRLHSLLVEPVGPILQEKGELIVVPTGALGYLPFETLTDSTGTYLVEQSHVRYAQSLTVLRQLQGRDYPAPERSLLALGGATYGAKQQTNGGTLVAARSGSGDVASETQASTLLRGAERRMERGQTPRPTYQQLGYQSWGNLPGTKTEAMTLGKIDSSTATVLTGTSASEDTLRSMSRNGQLSTYRRLHFATHGIAVPEAPKLSALVLSQVGASDSLAAQDGYLTMEEIANLKMRADVAVLSACQTGLGKVVAGEGVVSLSHAFLRAGANATLVSQWKVLDKSTRQFMTAVYERAKTRGTTFANAVTETKRAFIAGEYGPKNTDPLRWAPFVYYGRK